MPYTPAQCRLFGAKASRGERVPRDWKAHCKRKTLRERYAAARKEKR